MSERKVQIEISPQSVLTIVGVLAGIGFLIMIRNVILLAFIALIISSSLYLPIKKLSEKGLPHWVSVTLVYLGVSTVFLLLLSIVSVPLTRETLHFIESIPDLISDVVDRINSLSQSIGGSTIQGETAGSTASEAIDFLLENFQDILSTGTQSAAGVVKVLVRLFGGIVQFLTTLTLAVYLSLDHDSIFKTLLDLIQDTKLRKRVKKLVHEIELKLGTWLLGQATIALTSGTLIWLALSLIGLPYALPLGVLTGLLVNIPIFGATLSTIPALLVAIASGKVGLIIGVPLIYVLEQQFENNILAPNVMSGAIGVRPVVVILAILIGAEIAGISGIILAVPVAGIVQLLMDFMVKEKKGT